MHHRSTIGCFKSKHGGFSFIEVLVTAALVALVFGGLFAAVQAMITLISDSKAKAGATALATERLEYIRSLTYTDVGTDGGVPSGAIPQTRSVTLNELTYHERVLIEYVDDPADGAGAADGNGIVADYKRAKIEYSWLGRNGTSSVALVTNIVPAGVETTAGGGTLRVYVNDAAVQPVAGASVRFVNDTGTTSIDTIRFTDPSGMAQLGGAPALSSYEIYVSRAGYSTDGTAIATGTLSSPSQPVVSVAESSVTTQYFQIDELSTMQVRTVGVPTYGTYDDSFGDSSRIASSTGVSVGGGTAELAGAPGSYATSGTLIATTTIPSPLDGWYSLDWTASTSASTSVAIALYYPVGTTTVRVPDIDLPGNSVGFTTAPIDITALDPSTYPALQLGATLTTVDTNETPSLTAWSVTHIASQPTLSGIPMTSVGEKTLGSDGGGSDVYKNVFTGGTDASGDWVLNDVEYDVYSFTIDDPSYDVIEVCPSDRIALPPDTTEEITFTIGSVAGSRLLVTVTDASDQPVPNAAVRLEQPGYDETQTTSLCGQTFFSGGGLSAAESTVTVSKPGYTTAIETDVPVSSTSTLSVPIN
ncbi:MAG TPA: carboxypeptidase-like regulatory domain-containing protein [Candidatus Paceibacterota bacterium]|nr:carboxypeptidase-like regulatory domain-containing protein [Candidatus Paceibacterota bacterium]